MATDSKIIVVDLNEPYNGVKQWVFGCKAAIYQQLPAHTVGIALTTLQSRVKLVINEPYSTEQCTITLKPLHRAKTNRGNYERRVR